MKENIKIKKTLVGGFQPQEVLNLVSGISEELEKSEAAYIKLEESYQSEKEELEIRLNGIMESYSEKQSELDRIRTENEALRKQCETLEKDLLDREAEIRNATDEIRELKKTYPVYKEKALKYDQMTAQISDALVSARADAERLREKARGDSLKIVRESAGVMGDLIGEIRNYRMVSAVIREKMKESFDSLQKQLEHSDRSIEMLNEMLSAYSCGEITLD